MSDTSELDHVAKLTDEWQMNGPWTFDEFFNICKMVNDIPEDDRDIQLLDTLSEVVHKFSPLELNKLMSGFRDLNNGPVLKVACDCNFPSYLPIHKFNKEQLKVCTTFKKYFDIREIMDNLNPSWDQLIEIFNLQILNSD